MKLINYEYRCVENWIGNGIFIVYIYKHANNNNINKPEFGKRKLEQIEQTNKFKLDI